MRMRICLVTAFVVVSCGYPRVSSVTAVTPDEVQRLHPFLRPPMAEHWALALRRNGHDPTDLESIKKALADPEMYTTRMMAIGLLGARMGTAAIPMIAPSLDDPEPSVRYYAARMLAVLGDKRGLARMRQDLAEFTPKRTAAQIDQSVDLDEKQKREAKRQRIGRLFDALRAAQVLAEFGDSSGYDLATAFIATDEFPGRFDAVFVLTLMSRNTDLAVLRRENRDADAVLLALARTEHEPAIIMELKNSALGHRRPEFGLKILKTLAQSPHVSAKQRGEAERNLRYLKRRLERQRAESQSETKDK